MEYRVTSTSSDSTEGADGVINGFLAANPGIEIVSVANCSVYDPVLKYMQFSITIAYRYSD